MALDLSGASESPVEDNSANTLCNCVLLSSEIISSPGTNDILFHVSDVGHLILANFLVENVNGNYYLKKHCYTKLLTEENTDLRTNLCLDKSILTAEDHNHPLEQVHNTNQSSDLGTSDKLGCINSDMSVNAGHRYHTQETPEATTTLANVTSSHSLTKTDSMDSKQPLDTSLTGQVCSEQDEEELKSISHTASSVLGRIVSQLLSEIRKRNNASNNNDGASLKQDIIVCGHNLSELERFVQQLRQYRLKLGLSQVQLSNELVKHYNNRAMFSQALLSRFEKLNVTVRSAYRLLPYLQVWINHAEQKQCNELFNSSSTALRVFPHPLPIRAVGRARLTTLARLGHNTESSPPMVLALVNKQGTCVENPSELDHQRTSCQSTDSNAASNLKCKLSDPQQRRNRRKRTCFSTEAITSLTKAYANNPRPTSSDLSTLAYDTGYDRESIRVWFCNRRQLDSEINNKKN